MKVVVIGGTGLIGSKVGAKLGEHDDLTVTAVPAAFTSDADLAARFASEVEPLFEVM